MNANLSDTELIKKINVSDTKTAKEYFEYVDELIRRFKVLSAEFCEEVNPFDDDPNYQRYKRGEITKTEWWDLNGWSWYACESLDSDDPK